MTPATPPLRLVPAPAVRRAPRGRAPAAALLALALVAALAGPAAQPAAAHWDERALQAAGQRLGAAGARAAADLQQVLLHLRQQQEAQQQRRQPLQQPHQAAQAAARYPAPSAPTGPVEAAGAAELSGDPIRLQIVNDFFNRRIRFASDQQNWGVEDHWTTPLEVLARGQGDCEDYAIAKYAILLAAGVPASRLRLVYVRARLPAAQPGAAPMLQPHMVLAYHAEPGDEPLILDNLRPDILPAGQRPDLMPVFSFNSEGLWDAATAQPAGHPLVRLSRWREVVQRLRAEGWQP